MTERYKNIIIISGLALLLSGGVTYAFLAQDEESVNAHKQNSKEKTTGHVFSDEKYRFSFSYPENWNEIHTANTVKVCEVPQTAAYPDSEQKGYCIFVEAFELPDPDFLSFDDEPLITESSQQNRGGKEFTVKKIALRSPSHSNVPWYGLAFETHQSGYAYHITGRSFAPLGVEQEGVVEDLVASFVIREDAPRIQQFTEASGKYELSYPANWSATEKNMIVSLGSPTWVGEPEWTIEERTDTSMTDILQSVRSSKNNGSFVGETMVTIKSGENGTLLTFRRDEENTFVFVVDAGDARYVAKGRNYKTRMFQDMVSSINFLQ